MKENLTKRLGAALLTVVMAAVLVTPALAAGSDITPGQEQTQTYTYTAPTSPMAIDGSIITASAHRAASPILGMMGVNATSGFGMINGAAPSDLATAQSSAALGIWGSSLNQNPDPYYWNYFYNFYAAENGLALSTDALINDNVAASPGGADSTLKEEYGNVSVSLSTRPDILVGVASGNNGSSTDGYDAQLDTIHSFAPGSEYYQEGDETYSPKLVSYQMTTIKEMIESVHRLADAISAVEKETGKTTRYGDVQVIADDYENYVYGLVAYVQQQLAAKGLEQKTVAVVTAINEDGTYTLADSVSRSATSLVRAYEYTMTTCDSLVDEIGGTTATLDQLLSADAIVTINNQNVTQTAMLESFGDKTYDGILVTNTPSTLYGMTMNSIENAMGYAYVIGSIYCDELDLDPVELCAYFYQHFWHISDLDSLATVVKTNFSGTILPQGVSATLSSAYSEAAIQAKIDAGMAYLKANPDKFTGINYSTIGMGKAPAFSDVKSGDWFYEAVSYVYTNGIMEGVSDGVFAPDSAVTRAQAVTMLARRAGVTVDTTKSPWYADAQAWAVANDVSDGTRMTDTITRQELVTMIWRSAGEKKAEKDLSAYSDAGQVADYAQDAMKWAVANGIINGTTATTLTPAGTALRSQIAQIFMNWGK